MTSTWLTMTNTWLRVPRWHVHNRRDEHLLAGLLLVCHAPTRTDLDSHYRRLALRRTVLTWNRVSIVGRRRARNAARRSGPWAERIFHNETTSILVSFSSLHAIEQVFRSRSMSMRSRSPVPAALLLVRISSWSLLRLRMVEQLAIAKAVGILILFVQFIDGCRYVAQESRHLLSICMCSSMPDIPR